MTESPIEENDMARYETPAVTANGSSQALPMYNPRSGGDSTLKTVTIQGTFGGGTATLEISADGGVTSIPFTVGGSPVTFTSNDSQNLSICSDAQKPLLVSFDLTGATTPDIKMIIFDVR